MCLNSKEIHKILVFLLKFWHNIFRFNRSFLTKLNISCCSKKFSDPWKIFSCLKNVSLSVENFLKWTQALKGRTFWPLSKNFQLNLLKKKMWLPGWRFLCTTSCSVNLSGIFGLNSSIIKSAIVRIRRFD